MGRDPAEAVQGVEGFTDDWIAFNTAKAPMSDPNVRKAVSLAINRQAIIAGLNERR